MKKVAKIFFGIGIVCLLITIIFAIVNINIASDTKVNLRDELSYEKAKAMYNSTGKNEYKVEMQNIENRKNKEEFINKMYTIGLYVFGGITVGMFTTGMVIRVKEKNKI